MKPTTYGAGQFVPVALGGPCAPAGAHAEAASAPDAAFPFTPRVGPGRRRPALAGLTLLLALGQAGPAFAAGIIVNDPADNAVAGDGSCTLREAIHNANNDTDTTEEDCVAGDGEDTITFSVSGTIPLGSTLPDITDPVGLTINGTGQSVTVSGQNLVQAIVVESGAVLSLKNVKVAAAHARSEVGGGILNRGTTTRHKQLFFG